MDNSQLIYDVTVWGLISAWICFAIVFITRKRAAGGAEQKRDSSARIGILLEAFGYACTWIFRRRNPLLIPEWGDTAGIILSVAALILAFASVVFIVRAVKTLGKQWATAARIIDHHELITEGPYRIVRNPIYAGMLGMLIATGLAVSRLPAMLAGIALFWIGTLIRVRVEEKLLLATFGEQFEEYKRKVPSLIPGIR